ncbi:MAG TPA: hypothetical protein VLK59_17230 [Solirubrobacteraceae bacterium]|nr:hypothetical protein [Solirubrobacteraceae bacterium]
MHLRALLAHIRLSALALGLSFSHLRLLLRHLRLTVAVGGLGAMPIGGTLTTSLKLTLGLVAAARSHEREHGDRD